MKIEELNFIKVNYSHKLVSFIKYNIKKYIEEVISEENIEFDEILELLKTDIDENYKIDLLNYTNKPISIMNKYYSEELKYCIADKNFDLDDISNLLEQYLDLTEKLQILVESISTKYLKYILENKIYPPFQLCKKIFSNDKTDIENKKRFFAMVVINFNKEECIECLKILKLKEYLAAFNGKRPTVPVNEANEKILEVFLNKNWISGYHIDKNKNSLYRINGKRVKIPANEI